MVRFELSIKGTKKAIARGDRIISAVPKVSSKLREKLLRKVRDQAIINVATTPVSKTGTGQRYFGQGPLSGIFFNKTNWLIYSGGNTSTLAPPYRIGGILERGAKPHPISFKHYVSGKTVTYQHPGFVSVHPIELAAKKVFSNYKDEVKSAEEELVNA